MKLFRIYAIRKIRKEVSVRVNLKPLEFNFEAVVGSNDLYFSHSNLEGYFF